MSSDTIRLTTAQAIVRFLANQLIEAFWPGPLTLVLPKKPIISSLVSSGLATAAFRVPRHPLLSRNRVMPEQRNLRRPAIVLQLPVVPGNSQL